MWSNMLEKIISYCVALSIALFSSYVSYAESIENEQNRFYKKKTEYSSKIPPLIFLPGVLGTRIKECNERDRCEVIWGNFNSLFKSPDLYFDQEKNMNLKLFMKLPTKNSIPKS